MNIFYIIKNPYKLFYYLSTKGCYRNMVDDKYLALLFRATIGKKLNILNPQTFNEKLQWLKLHDRKPEYTIMVDKHLVKPYVAKRIGEQYIIPTIGVWDDPDEIDFNSLPNRYVLKCNHNSGLGMYICHDKSKMDIEDVKCGLKKGLKQDYYLTSREWPYKDVQRKVIAEQYMEDTSGGLIDYKVHCFNGEPRYILVCSDRFSKDGLTEDFVTPTWERMSVKRSNIKVSEVLMEKPKELEEILILSKVLSKDIPFVRVDFYIINHNVYFSEMTFFPASGLAPFEPDDWDKTFGSWLHLPNE